MDSENQVLMQNAKFYEAFEHKNLRVIDEVWSHKENVKCVHPGWTVLAGWKEVRQSWVSIFANEAKMKFSLRNIRTDVFGKLALVILEEEITFVSGTMMQTQSIIATNIFEHDGSGWRMIHHHGSPVLRVGPSARGSEGQQDGYRFRYN